MSEHAERRAPRAASDAAHGAGHEPSAAAAAPPPDFARTAEALGHTLLQSLDGVAALTEIARAETALNAHALRGIALARLWSGFALALAWVAGALALGFALAALAQSAWVGAACVFVLHLLAFVALHARAAYWRRQLGFEATRRGARGLARALRGEADA
jgi:hypothetical protein